MPEFSVGPKPERQNRRRSTSTLTPEAAAARYRMWKQTWYNFSIGFNDEQGAALRQITEKNRLSLGEVIDAVLRPYLRDYFGVEWPYAKRNRRRWRLHQYKVKSHNQTVHSIYGILITYEQKAVFDRVLAELGGGNGMRTALIEAALAKEVPIVFHMPWPRARRLRSLAHREPLADRQAAQ